MLFNSPEFIVFFPLVFILYWFAFNKDNKLQNLFLLIAGSVFYGWWDWRFLILLYGTASIDFTTAYLISGSNDKNRRKALVGITLAANLAVLGFFKYFNFFVDSALFGLERLGVHANTPLLHVILPVGISFYTFQSIAYVIDVYRKQIEPCRNYFTFLSFVSFFPQLVAGPISRAKDLLPQFYVPRKFSYDLAINGLRLILFGLFKKMVIADNLARLVEVVYDKPSDYGGAACLIATLAFSIQIYCDFSGYSDIAIGTARLLGFNLMQNFNLPYGATSLKNFWQRWHISLSTWFRDYLYIPMGGNKKGIARTYFNLLITFVVSGLWHGANATFVIWGYIHGMALIIEDAMKRNVKVELPVFISWLFTFSFVSFAWIFFRAETLTDALTIIQNIFSGFSLLDVTGLFLKVYYTKFFVLCLAFIITLFLLIDYLLHTEKYRRSMFTAPKPIRLLVYYLVIILIIFLGISDSAPEFIYFKF